MQFNAFPSRFFRMCNLQGYYNGTVDEVSFPDWADESIIEDSGEFFWDVHDFMVSYHDINTVASGMIFRQWKGTPSVEHIDRLMLECDTSEVKKIPLLALSNSVWTHQQAG